MATFSEKDLACFRRRPLERRAELEALMEISVESGRPAMLDQTSVSRLSRMDTMRGQAMARETERRRLAEIRRINAALGCMEDGGYGYCVVSGDPIPRVRLELDPSVATTVDHAG